MRGHCTEIFLLSRTGIMAAHIVAFIALVACCSRLVLLSAAADTSSSIHTAAYTSGVTVVNNIDRAARQACTTPGSYICSRITTGGLKSSTCMPHSSSRCDERSCTSCNQGMQQLPANSRTACATATTCGSFQCQPGFEVADGRCRLCRSGFFKEGWSSSNRCKACPAGTITLGKEGSDHDSFFDCVAPATGLKASPFNKTAADPGSTKDGLSLLLDQLNYISNYTGKGGRRNGGGGSAAPKRLRGLSKSAYCLYRCNGVDSRKRVPAAYLAASPAEYDSRDSWLGNSLLTPVKHQGGCGTCVAVSIVAAGEAAIASALNISGSEVQSKFNFLKDFSYYCLPGEVGSRSCNLGWDIVQALNRFPGGSSVFFVRDVRGGCIGPQHRKMYQLLADIKQLSNACSRIIRCQEKLQLPGAPTFLKKKSC